MSEAMSACVNCGATPDALNDADECGECRPTPTPASVGFQGLNQCAQCQLSYLYPLEGCPEMCRQCHDDAGGWTRCGYCADEIADEIRDREEARREAGGQG